MKISEPINPAFATLTQEQLRQAIEREDQNESPVVVSFQSPLAVKAVEMAGSYWDAAMKALEAHNDTLACQVLHLGISNAISDAQKSMNDTPMNCRVFVLTAMQKIVSEYLKQFENSQKEIYQFIFTTCHIGNFKNAFDKWKDCSSCKLCETCEKTAAQSRLNKFVKNCGAWLPNQSAPNVKPFCLKFRWEMYKTRFVMFHDLVSNSDMHFKAGLKIGEKLLAQYTFADLPIILCAMQFVADWAEFDLYTRMSNIKRKLYLANHNPDITVEDADLATHLQLTYQTCVKDYADTMGQLKTTRLSL